MLETIGATIVNILLPSLGRLLAFERAFGLPGSAHWPFGCIVSGFLMIFWENNKALKLKLVRPIPVLSVRLEEDPVSKIVAI